VSSAPSGTSISETLAARIATAWARNANIPAASEPSPEKRKLAQGQAAGGAKKAKVAGATESPLRTAEELNTCSAADFEQQVALLFEKSTELSGLLRSKRPFASHAALIDEAEQIIKAAPEQQQIRILSSHPRLGQKKKGSMSKISASEQKHGTHADEVLEQLAKLNAEYEAKFGFIFMEFVNGRSLPEIIPVLQQRLTGTKDGELMTGLEAFVSVARSRHQSLGNRKDSKL